jgi:cytochrome c-type biogenesis protein CcmH
MEFWFLAGLLTLATLFVLVRSLSGGDGVAVSAAKANASHYQSQLAELERQQAVGVIASGEAEAAKIEAARRLIHARDNPGTTLQGLDLARVRQALAVFVLIAVPLIGAGVYARLGSPKLPDMPLDARRLAEPDTFQALDSIQRMEAHLFLNPKDGSGHEMLAPLYFQMGRYAEAAKSFEQATLLLGETPQRLASRGEAMVAEKGGVVDNAALAVFDRVLALEPQNGPARFYKATALKQDGKRDEARDMLTTLRNETADVDIRRMLDASLMALDVPAEKATQP